MPKASGILLESELHGGELNQGMGCGLMGLRGARRQGQNLSTRSHASYALGASSHLSPGQTSLLSAALRDFTPGVPSEGSMDRVALGLEPSTLQILHPTPLGRQHAVASMGCSSWWTN